MIYLSGTSSTVGGHRSHALGPRVLRRQTDPDDDAGRSTPENHPGLQSDVQAWPQVRSILHSASAMRGPQLIT
jgi:hypothetical protein